MMHLLIVKLIGCLGWLSNIAFAQLELGEAVTASVSFPDVGMSCIGNLATFVTTALRGRLDLEMGARDVLATLRGPKLENILHRPGFGRTTCTVDRLGYASVVMLSIHPPNSSIEQFMKYISNAHGVESILLECRTLKTAPVYAAVCNCNTECHCIVFWTVVDITIMLGLRMPGSIKQLSDSLCLLPSLNCLRGGCHGCDKGLLYVEIDDYGNKRFEERRPEVEYPATVWETLPKGFIEEKGTCICIPVHEAPEDKWTALLMRMLMSKDMEDRGVSLERGHAEQRKDGMKTVDYSTAYLIVPRFTEILVNFVLTGWFKVDGFSSALVARRAIKDYVVDSEGTSFAANVFLTKALIYEHEHNGGVTDRCQVLTFRGPLLGLRTLSFIACGVNLICTVSWVVLIALEGGPGKIYNGHTMPPSKSGVAVIITAIGIGLVMDCSHLWRGRFRDRRELLTLWAVVVFEVMCLISMCAVALALGAKFLGDGCIVLFMAWFG